MSKRIKKGRVRNFDSIVPDAVFHKRRAHLAQFLPSTLSDILECHLYKRIWYMGRMVICTSLELRSSNGPFGQENAWKFGFLTNPCFWWSDMWKKKGSHCLLSFGELLGPIYRAILKIDGWIYIYIYSCEVYAQLIYIGSVHSIYHKRISTNFTYIYIYGIVWVTIRKQNLEDNFNCFFFGGWTTRHPFVLHLLKGECPEGFWRVFNLQWLQNRIWQNLVCKAVPPHFFNPILRKTGSNQNNKTWLSTTLSVLLPCGPWRDLFRAENSLAVLAVWIPRYIKVFLKMFRVSNDFPISKYIWGVEDHQLFSLASCPPVHLHWKPLPLCGPHLVGTCSNRNTKYIYCDLLWKADERI